MSGESARQHLLLSPLVSLHRLEHLRRAVLAGDNGPDALLLIGGVDSRDDEVNSLALNHLFVSSASDAGTGSILHPELEDVVVLIERTCVHVYIAAHTSHTLASVAQLWPHTVVHTLPKPKVEDADAQARVEDHKMETFRDIVSSPKSIGVVFGTIHTVASADPLPARDCKAVVEKWPLVQSYAFDPAGNRPFFTMEKAVVDATSAVVRAVLGGRTTLPCDAQMVLQDTLYETASLVASQFAATLAYIEGRIRRGLSLAKVTDSEVKEVFSFTLSQYAQHCRLGAGASADGAADDVGIAVGKGNSHARLSFNHPTKPLKVCRTIPFLSAVHQPDHIGMEGCRELAAQLCSQAQVFLRTSAAQASLQPGAAATAMADAWKAYTSSSVTSSDATILAAFDSAVPCWHVYLEATRNGLTVGDTFLITVSDGVATCGSITSCVPYLEGVLANAPTSALDVAVAEALDQPPSKRKSIAVPGDAEGGDVGRIILDVTRADGAAVMLGGLADVGGTGAISASSLSLASKTVGTGGGATACFCEKGLVVSHPRYGTIGPATLATLAVHNPLDTVSPVTVALTVPASAPSWAAGLSCFVLLRASSFARREFLGNVLPKWRAAAGGSTTAEAAPDSSGPTDVDELAMPAALRRKLATDAACLGTADAASRKLLLLKDAPLGEAFDPFPSAPNSLAGFFSRGGGSDLANLEDEDPESDARRKDRDARRQLAVAAPQLTLAAHALHCPAPNAQKEAPLDKKSCRVEVHLVSGAVGAGKHKLALALHRTLEAEAAASRGTHDASTFLHRVHITYPDRDSALTWSAVKLAEELRALVRQAETFQREHPSRAASRVYCAVVVVVPPVAALPDVHATVAGVAGCGVASSTAVVNPDSFFLDPATAAVPGSIPGPMVWRSLVPGFLDSILLLAPSRGRHGTSESASRVERAIRYAFNAALPSAFGLVYDEVGDPITASMSTDDLADALCGPLLSRQALHYCYSVDEVVRRVMKYDAEAGRDGHDPALWPLSDMRQRVARRVVSCNTGTSYSSSEVCAVAQASMPDMVHLHFERLPLIEPDVFDFMSHLSDEVSVTKSSGSPFYNVFRTVGTLYVEGREHELAVVRFKPQMNRLRKTRSQGGDAGMPTLRQEQDFHFFTLGRVSDAQREAMQTYILRRVAFRGSLVGDVLLPKERDQDRADALTRGVDPRPLLSRGDLTDADLDRIASDAATKGKPLPAGWTFDVAGAYHNSHTGASAVRRPDIEDLATAFIEQHNTAAREFNEKLASAVVPASAARPGSSSRGRTAKEL